MESWGHPRAEDLKENMIHTMRSHPLMMAKGWWRKEGEKENSNTTRDIY